MIKGKAILSPHHLYNAIPANIPVSIFWLPDYNHVSSGMAVKIDRGVYANKVIVFQSYSNDDKFHLNDLYQDEELYKICSLAQSRFGGALVLDKNDGAFSRDSKGLIIPPSNLDELWNSFIASNKKQFNTLDNKIGIFGRGDEGTAKYILMLTDCSKNFFFWAMDIYFRKHVRLFQIKEIMFWNEQYGQLSGKLTRGTITGYTNLNQVYQLEDEIRHLRQEKRINDVINSFNTQQKKLLKDIDKNSLTKRDKEAFSKFASMSLTKRTNFIRKMSTIEDVNEILKQLHHVTNVLFDWNRESFLDYLANNQSLQAEILQDKNGIVLVKVGDYDTVKRLAKNTNWCISKNKKYWNDYVEFKSGATQYAIFNFNLKEDDLKSIVGFTSIADNGIVAAHDFTNNNLMEGSDLSNNNQKSYLARFLQRSNIYSILNQSNIDLGLVIDITPFIFKWTKKDFLDFLYACVGKMCATILKDEGDKLCVSVTSSNIVYVLGDSYARNTSHEDYHKQHILFLDFSLRYSSPYAFYYAIIDIDRSTHECYCIQARNPKHMSETKSFNSLLRKYGLPYDIIRRVDDDYSSFKDDFMYRNWDLSILSEHTREWTKRFAKEENDELYSMIISDIRNLSFDIIHWIYNNGLTLSDLLEESRVINIVTESYNQYRMSSSAIQQYGNSPTEEDVKCFWNETLQTEPVTRFVGHYLLFIEIMSNERNDYVTASILRRIDGHNYKSNSGFVKTILHKVAEHINYSEDDNTMSYFLQMIYKFNCDDVISFIETLPTLSDFGKKVIESVKRTSRSSYSYSIS